MKSCAALIMSCLLLSSCATLPNSPTTNATLHGDAAHPIQTEDWLRTELYFGIGAIDDETHAINEMRWREFLDREVTSRFPAGLTVFDAYGQWREKNASTTERLHTKVLVLLCPDTPAQRADVEAIRLAWKKLSGDQSVLRVTEHSDVSF